MIKSSLLVWESTCKSCISSLFMQIKSSLLVKSSREIKPRALFSQESKPFSHFCRTRFPFRSRLQKMPKSSNDNMSETMDTLALKFVKEMRSAVSEQITLSIQKEIISQIEKQNIISRKTSSASSQANATSLLSNDAHKKDKDKEISSLQSNEHPIADKESAKDVHSVAEDINKREKKKKRKRKRQTDDDGETMNRFSCNQQ